MAPTTLEGQKTTTSPYGRDIKTAGSPIKVSELVSTFDAVAYVERVTCDTPAHARKAKRAVKKAFEYQLKGMGTTFVEVASNCPSQWKCTPVQSLDWLNDKVYPYYPLGVFKDKGKPAAK
jgi:2-oxoglutarate ferredoxin oxidoreductase subunit beta